MIVTGKILKAISGFYYVDTGAEIIECKARGRLRREKITPLVGDTVEFSISADGKGAVEAVLPRRNAFVRPPIANLDQMVIMASAAIPISDPYLIDRMTAIAVQNNCLPVICINKTDIDSGEVLYEIYKSTGFPTLRTSAQTGEGIRELAELITDKISAFTGNSGVGKSSILNALSPEFQIPVGDVSQKLGRGRHTTRHVELYRLKSGAIVADTPGFSSFDSEEMELCKADKLQDLFPEFAPYLGLCRFTNCAHNKDSGCAVFEAVQQGSIHQSRHASYVKLFEEARLRKDWDK